jgi:hypothetical protein
MTYDLRNQGPRLGQTYGRLNRLMESPPPVYIGYCSLIGRSLRMNSKLVPKRLYDYMTSSYPLFVTHQDRTCQMIVSILNSCPDSVC